MLFVAEFFNGSLTNISSGNFYSSQNKEFTSVFVATERGIAGRGAR